jgi:hypothetical protein
MKKILFTAIALVAFSGVSMANTIDDEEVVKDKESELKVIRKGDPCLGSYVNTYNANVAEYGQTVAGQIADGAWRSCRKALGLDEG